MMYSEAEIREACGTTCVNSADDILSKLAANRTAKVRNTVPSYSDKTECGHSLATCHTDKCFMRYTIDELLRAAKELDQMWQYDGTEDDLKHMALQADKNRVWEKRQKEAS